MIPARHATGEKQNALPIQLGIIKNCSSFENLVPTRLVPPRLENNSSELPVSLDCSEHVFEQKLRFKFFLTAPPKPSHVSNVSFRCISA